MLQTAGKFRAIARIQPLDETDEPAEEYTVACRKDGDKVRIADVGLGGSWKDETAETFEFDRVFGMDSTYRDIHSQELRFVVESALRGRNSTLFISGTSTCGKRHMVVGQPFLTAAEGGISGLAERIVGDIYARDAREEWVLSISMYSIYKEIVMDLFAPAPSGLSVSDDAGDGNFEITGLTDVSINNTADLLQLLRLSIQSRERLEEREMGRDAHSTIVLAISLQCTLNPQTAKVHLVDLAGSDDPAIGSAVLQYDKNMLTQSVQMLGQIFAMLSGGKQTDEVDYSQSKLTMLMKQYLQGSASVAVLAVCSPMSTSRTGMREGLLLAEKARGVFVQAHPEKNAPTAEDKKVEVEEREKAEKAGASLAAMFQKVNTANKLAKGFGALATSSDAQRSTKTAAAPRPSGGAGGGEEAAGDAPQVEASPSSSNNKFAPDRMEKHAAVHKGPPKSPRSRRSSVPRPGADGSGDAPRAPSPRAQRPKSDGLKGEPPKSPRGGPPRSPRASVAAGSKAGIATLGALPKPGGGGDDDPPAKSPRGRGGPRMSANLGADDASGDVARAPPKSPRSRARTPAGSGRAAMGGGLSVGGDDDVGDAAPKSPRRRSASAVPKSPRGGSITARGGGESESQYKGKPGELQTILEDVFADPEAGTGTQIDNKTQEIYKKLPISSDESNARRPPAAITVAADTKAAVDDSFSIPMMVRSHEVKVLGIRVNHSAEAKKSHEILNGPEEMVAILNLINESYSDDKFWDKKRQGGMNNPVVAMIHNVLVRVRRFHRMLEDTQMEEFAEPVLEAMLRMYEFCTTVMTRSGRSALYNQAVKHVGEFYCYKYVSPPILAMANITKRGAPGSPNAILREGISAMYGLLIKGELNDASRAAVRESLRCAACSWAPPLMLCEVALDAMTENLKNRDVFALRTREMGLTMVYMVISRHQWTSVKKFFDAPDRPTGAASKLHTLVACMGMARAEASKSALNKALTNEIMPLLKMHAGDQKVTTVVEGADIDKGVASDLVAAMTKGSTLQLGELKAPPKSPRPGAKSPRR